MRRMEDNIWTCSPLISPFLSPASETCSVPLMRAGNSLVSPKASIGEEFHRCFNICAVVEPKDVPHLVVGMLTFPTIRKKNPTEIYGFPCVSHASFNVTMLDTKPYVECLSERSCNLISPGVSTPSVAKLGKMLTEMLLSLEGIKAQSPQQDLKHIKVRQWTSLAMQ